ncbi:MAG: M1 family metallopeptidase, partial [Bryobacteraceae bacterium]
LYPTLRVSGVYSDSGAPLDFVQEDKKLDAAFGVMLPAAAKAGDTVRLLTVYDGKDALRADGNDTYYLMSGARDSWYPSGSSEFGDFATFHMTFHIPKGLQIVATGKQVSVSSDGGGMVKSVWESGSPIPVAGFNIGDFKTSSAKTPQGFGVDAFADVGVPDMYSSLAQSDTLGGLSAVGALKGEVSHGSIAIQIYSDFFGKLPYDHVALTEQTACNYGQSWPMLVYLPICGFWDKTVQHQLGLLENDASYWREVTPHEVSHQWWGNLVGFKSYRDQWMSEGFANFSVGVFLMNTSPKMDDFRDFWKEQQKNLLQKNAEGVRPIDAGALTMGGRVSNSKSGEDVYQLLIYSKGAYILHMLEMQYWTPTEGEAPFKRAMQQFVSDYAGKAATTEDFKASMEKSMPKAMDLRGNGKLDWFFDEYVYGTELPHYTISSEFSVGADGVTSVHLKLTQSNVSNNFVMRLPLYMQYANGNVIRLTNVVIRGNNTIDTTIPLGKLPAPGKTLLLNYNADVLSD